MQLAMTDKLNEMVDMMWSDVDANAARQMTLILAADLDGKLILASRQTAATKYGDDKQRKYMSIYYG